ncbi:MAG: hypothetical protein B7Z52_07715, partial [Burkholderiales bacterium 12-64-5]
MGDGVRSIQRKRRKGARDRIRSVPRADFHHIPRGPGAVRAIFRLQRDMEGGAAETSGIEAAALGQTPGFIGRRRPVRHMGLAGEAAQVLHPMAQGSGIISVHFHPV